MGLFKTKFENEVDLRVIAVILVSTIAKKWKLLESDIYNSMKHGFLVLYVSTFPPGNW